jgi:hypothetical protein
MSAPVTAAATLDLGFDADDPKKLPDREARLVVSWISPAAAEAFAQTGDFPTEAILGMVRQAKVLPLSPEAVADGLRVDAGPPSEPGSSVPIAIADLSGRFWDGVLDGRGDCLVGVGVPFSATASQGLRLRSLRASTPGKKPKLKRSTVETAHGPLPIAVRTRPKASRGRRPCVYLLPGLGGDEDTRLRDDAFLEAMDAGGPWAPLLVGVSTRTTYGSAYIGPGNPGLAEALAESVPAAVERDYAVWPRADQRVIAGQSTGAYTAITLAMTRPGRFGAVVASAPDALDLESWLLDAQGSISATALAWMRLEAALGGPGQMTSLAASWSPCGSGDREWPVNLETGELRPEVFERWLSHSPIRMLESPQVRAALRELDGRLYIGASLCDEFGLAEPTIRFSERLTALGIPHRLELDHLSHFDATQRLASLTTMALDSLPALDPGEEPAP